MRKQPMAGVSLGLALVAAVVIMALRRRNTVKVARVVYEAPFNEQPAQTGGTMNEAAYARWLDDQRDQTGNWQDSSTLGADPRDIGRGEWGGEDDIPSYTLAELGIELDAPNASPSDLEPFTLADLGLSEEEIAAIEAIVAGPAGKQGKEATMTAHDPKDGMHVDDCEPFSLRDLGLTDAEIEALGLGDTLITPMAPAAKPQPTIAHVNDRAFEIRRVPPAKPVTFRHIWWRPLWKQEVVISHPRFYFWLWDWATQFGLEGPVGTMITAFGRYGWWPDDLIRQYLDEVDGAEFAGTPLRYGTTKWSDLSETIYQLQRLGEDLIKEGKRLRGIAHQLREAEESALAASRMYASLGQSAFYVPCTCGLRLELLHYADHMIAAGYNDLDRAAKLTSELGMAMPALDELRKLGVIMPVPFDKPFSR